MKNIMLILLVHFSFHAYIISAPSCYSRLEVATKFNQDGNGDVQAYNAKPVLHTLYYRFVSLVPVSTIILEHYAIS